MSGIEYERVDTLGFPGSHAIIRAWQREDGGTWLLARGDYDHHQSYTAALLPTHPAELHRLVEAILGEPGEWVPHSAVYEEIREGDDGRLNLGSGPESCKARDSENPQWLRNHAANALALARQIEAQSAANAEAEREVEALAEELATEYRNAEGLVSPWSALSPAAQISWRAVASKVIADTTEALGRARMVWGQP